MFTCGSHYDVSFPSNLSLPNLEELSVYQPTMNILTRILNATTTLQRIKLHSIYTKMDKSEIKIILNTLLLSHKSLEYLQIIEDKVDSFDAISEGIEGALYDLGQKRAGDLEIRLQIDNKEQEALPKSSDVFLKISRIAAQLEFAPLNNWMMSLLICGNVAADEDWKNRRKEFKEKYERRFTTHVKSKEMFLFLSNIGCKINGSGWSKSILFW